MSESWVLVSSVSGPGLSVTWLGACWGAGDGVRGAGLPPGACGGGVVGVVCGARGFGGAASRPKLGSCVVARASAMFGAAGLGAGAGLGWGALVTRARYTRLGKKM